MGPTLGEQAEILCGKSSEMAFIFGETPVIGIMGTAKNTGKTTTLNAVARHLRRNETELVLTSIGYDGENLDTTTVLPKPRVNVEPQDTVITAYPLLRSSTATFKQVVHTGIQCALGPVCVALAATSGKVVLAGPTGTKDVGEVLRHVRREQKTKRARQIILLDGALSRMSPMVLATHVLVATGAARYQYPGFVVQDMEDMWSVFSLPVEIVSCNDLLWPHGLSVNENSEDLFQAVLRLKKQRRRSVAEAIDGCDELKVRVDGVVNPAVLDDLLARLNDRGIRGISLSFQHPIHLLLSGDPSMWRNIVMSGARGGYRISVTCSSELLGFTVSSYFPAYNESRRQYMASYVSPGQFIREIRSLTSLPCTDIVLEGTRALESWIDKAVQYTGSTGDSFGG
ncbi:MAG: hypothetical protein ACOX3V_08195 [Bacillota bacterium]